MAEDTLKTEITINENCKREQLSDELLLGPDRFASQTVTKQSFPNKILPNKTLLIIKLYLTNSNSQKSTECPNDRHKNRGQMSADKAQHVSSNTPAQHVLPPILNYACQRNAREKRK